MSINFEIILIGLRLKTISIHVITLICKLSFYHNLSHTLKICNHFTLLVFCGSLHLLPAHRYLHLLLILYLHIVLAMSYYSPDSGCTKLPRVLPIQSFCTFLFFSVYFHFLFLPFSLNTDYIY